MKCQRCQKREATILIKQSINGSEKEYALCQDCMVELGLANNFGFGFDNFLGAGFGSPQLFPSHNTQNLTGSYNSGVFVSGKKEEQICRHCNTTLDEVRKKGRLGCSYCYETFEEQLGQVFRRIQSGEKHRGRKMAESKEKNEINKLHEMIEELQCKIKAAVEKEDYESAAKWKTEILRNKEKIENFEKTKQLQENPDIQEKAGTISENKTGTTLSNKTESISNSKTESISTDKAETTGKNKSGSTSKKKNGEISGKNGMKKESSDTKETKQDKREGGESK